MLAGYMKVGLWVSSTSSDMDVYVSLRVVDDQDREIRYESLVPPIDPANIHPVGHGLLKVSHRKLDEDRSTDYWPVQSHLGGGLPAAAPKGRSCRSRSGLHPSSAVIRRGLPAADRHTAVLTGWTAVSRVRRELPRRGVEHHLHRPSTIPSYLQLPIVPPKPVTEKLVSEKENIHDDDWPSVTPRMTTHHDPRPDP